MFEREFPVLSGLNYLCKEKADLGYKVVYEYMAPLYGKPGVLNAVNLLDLLDIKGKYANQVGLITRFSARRVCGVGTGKLYKNLE